MRGGDGALLPRRGPRPRRCHAVSTQALSTQMLSTQMLSTQTLSTQTLRRSALRHASAATWTTAMPWPCGATRLETVLRCCILKLAYILVGYVKRFPCPRRSCGELQCMRCEPVSVGVQGGWDRGFSCSGDSQNVITTCSSLPYLAGA